jgi:hypothetical protein
MGNGKGIEVLIMTLYHNSLRVVTRKKEGVADG